MPQKGAMSPGGNEKKRKTKQKQQQKRGSMSHTITTTDLKHSVIYLDGWAPSSDLACMKRRS